VLLPRIAPHAQTTFVTTKKSIGKISHNLAAGIFSDHPAANVSLFKVSTYFNGTDISGAVTIAPDHNYSK